MERAIVIPFPGKLPYPIKGSFVNMDMQSLFPELKRAIAKQHNIPRIPRHLIADGQHRFILFTIFLRLAKHMFKPGTTEYRIEDLRDDVIDKRIHRGWFGESGILGDFNVTVHLIDRKVYMEKSAGSIRALMEGIVFFYVLLTVFACVHLCLYMCVLCDTCKNGWVVLVESSV